MVYITQKASPRYPQLTLEDFLSNDEVKVRPVILNETNTRTVVLEKLNDRYSFLANPVARTNILRDFNNRWDSLREVPRSDLYETFFIPKKSGGLRQINAPSGQLKIALYELKDIFEKHFGADFLYHTSAFAYVKGRSTIDAVKRHQTNESRWYLKLDLHDFFGSTTLDFVMSQFSLIYPFSEVVKLPDGERELRKALELAFLNGGLPQGTPISPLITNIMMIPIDHVLFNRLKNFEKNSFVYTRYADDFIISSRYNFMFRPIENLVVDTLSEFNAPFRLNREKTRYGSYKGQNYNLGLMVCSNTDGSVRITVGAGKKRQFRAMLYTYACDLKNGKVWDLADVQVLDGYRNYYRMVEGNTIDEIVNGVSEKCGIDILEEIKQQLRA